VSQCIWEFVSLAKKHAFISQKENLKPGVFSVPASTLALMPAEVAAFARSSAAFRTASVSVFFFRIGTITTCRDDAAQSKGLSQEHITHPGEGSRLSLNDNASFAATDTMTLSRYCRYDAAHLNRRQPGWQPQACIISCKQDFRVTAGISAVMQL